MFTRLGPWVVRHPVSVIIGWVLVIAALTGVSVLAQFRHWETSTSAQTDFLPKHYESARAKDIADKAFPQPAGVSAQLVVTRADGQQLTQADVRRAVALADDVRKQAPVKLENNLKNPLTGVRIDPATRSPNGKVVIGQATFDQAIVSPDVVMSTKLLRKHIRTALGDSGLRISVTGDAAAVVDTERESALVQYGMMLVILVLLLLIFRSWVVALVTVLAVALVAGAASGALVLVAHLTGLKLDQSVTGLMPVVLFGVGVDYIVFLLLRYQERLRLGEDRRTAMASAVQRVGAAITSSAFAVVVSFAALLLSQLTSLRVLGPALGFAVVFMLLAGLTLVPALFTLLGRRFARKVAQRGTNPHRVGTRIGLGVARSPLIVALLAIIAMVLPALAASSYKPNYEVTPYPAGSESARALDELATGYPLGRLAPAEVFVQKSGPLDAGEIGRFADRLNEVAGVGAVQPAVYTKSGDVARVAVLLKDAPSSKGAMETVAKRLRPAAASSAPAGTTVAVGGPTSALVDVQSALGPDMRLIFPVAGALIALILLLMLRSLVAPFYLMGGVVLGFLATLGGAVIVFQVLKGEPGLSFQLPLVVYLFVASIGTDYNILMISRLREEMDNGATARQAVALAITHAGPSVAAAGLILAASFGTLTLSTLLQQIGFAVAFGVLISAFVMSLFLIPALTALLGRAAWWPSRTRRR